MWLTCITEELSQKAWDYTSQDRCDVHIHYIHTHKGGQFGPPKHPTDVATVAKLSPWWPDWSDTRGYILGGKPHICHKSYLVKESLLVHLSTDRSNYTLALSVTELSNFLENCTDTWWYTQERGLISAISLWPAPQSQEGSPMSACSVPWGSLVPSSWKHTCKHLQKSILTIEISVATFSDTTMFLNCMRKSLRVAILQLERISDKTSQSSAMFSSALLLN